LRLWILGREGNWGEDGVEFFITPNWFFIDDEGRVQRTQVNESSGHKALDDAAIKVADIIEFTPALNREKRVPVWISLPITFTTR